MDMSYKDIFLPKKFSKIKLEQTEDNSTIITVEVPNHNGEMKMVLKDHEEFLRPGEFALIEAKEGRRKEDFESEIVVTDIDPDVTVTVWDSKSKIVFSITLYELEKSVLDPIRSTMNHMIQIIRKNKEEE